MSKIHAKYSPSASSRWMRCTGSIHLTQDIEDKQSPYALQGNAAHWLAEKCLTNTKLKTSDFVGFQVAEVGEYYLTKEDVEAVEKYVSFIKDEIKSAGEDAYVFIEKKLKATKISDYFFGTSDALILSKSGHLKIYDYKHGVGVLVSAIDNYQMYCYATLAVGYAKENNLAVNSIEIIIVQPRAGEDYISREVTTLDKFISFKTLLSEKIKEIESTEDNPQLTPGESQCRWCVIKAVCPEVRKKNLAIAKAEFSDKPLELPKPELLAVEDLIKILDHAEFFRSWLTSVENFMEGQALNGKKIPGYKLVSKRAYRKWSDEQGVVNYIRDYHSTLESSIFTKPELKSPAQVEALVKSKEGKAKIQQFIYTPQTAPTLARETDKRSEVTTLISAKDEFN